MSTNNNDASPTAQLSALLAQANHNKNNLASLRAHVSNLRNEVIRLEALVTCFGDKALVMPEDLGDWSQSSHRIQGLVSRIHQTHQLSVEVANLYNSSPDPSTSCTPTPSVP